MDKVNNFISKKNIIIILAITFVIAIISTINFSIALYSNNESTIILNLKNGDKINNITINRNLLNLNKFTNENLVLEKINDKGNSLVAINDVKMELELSVIDDLSINLDSKNDTINYTLNGNTYKTVGNNVSIYSSKIDVIKNSMSYKSIVIFFISYVILSIAIILIKNVLQKIADDKIKVFDIILLLISIFVIYLSSIYLFMMINKVLAIIPALCLTIYILIYFKSSIKGWKNIFLCISSVIGVMMIFIITPGNVPDEPSHYTRSYIDSVTLSKVDKNNLSLPVDIGQFLDKYTHDVHNLAIKYSGKSYMSDLLGNNNYSNLSGTPVNYENTKYLSFLPYLPSVIINFISRIVGLPVLITFLLCRLINLIISTILCYLAISITPRFKKIFSLIATFPIFLQQAAGINMDYLTNSVSFLFIAIILKYLFEDNKLVKKDLIVLFITGIILGLCKFGYFPILFLVLLISNEKFNNKKTALLFKIALIIIPLIISCFANLIALNNNNNSKSTDIYTITTVLSDPINSAKICSKTFITRFAADSFCALINGFGWSTKYQLELSLWTIGAIYIILLFIDNGDSKYLKLRDRIIMLVVWAFIYLVLYGVALMWTSINSNMINGLQARYFIPILPLFYIAISNNFFKVNIKDKWKLYCILVFVAHILTCISILNAFY